MSKESGVAVSIIIVNWRSINFTRKCVASIQRHCRGLPIEIVVIDNASGDDLSTLPEKVRSLQSPHNLGFAGANNLGAQLTTGRYVLFLNPDTELVNDAVGEMAAVLDSSEDIHIAGCRLLNEDRTFQRTCVQQFPTILNQILGTDLLMKRFPKSALWNPIRLDGDRRQAQLVPVVSGACLMVRRSCFEAAGGFSEESFMYGEEIDLCFRVSKLGGRVAFVPWAEIVHFGGQSSGKRGSAFSNVLIRRSVFLFLRNSRGLAYASAYRLFLAMSSIARVAVMSATLPLALVAGKDKIERQLSVIQKWFWIGLWCMGLWMPAIPGTGDRWKIGDEMLWPESSR